jgi:YfiR/HmsC-like
VPGLAHADRLPETDVEAAYLVNFLRYTQWPERSFESPDSPLIISVIGPNSVADRIRAVAFAAGRIGGRAIEVRSIPFQRGSVDAPLQSERDRQSLAMVRSSHLVFFHSEAGAVHPQAISDLWGYPVLTVSNARGFTDAGGMLGLFRSSGHIVFEANAGAIRNSGLLVSAKVLKLARVAARANR